MMLVQFSVENFKSFHTLTTWSLRATADTRLSHHVVTNEKGKGGAQVGVLRAAAIYGANAAGKSNLVLAMSFAQRLILNGTRGEERIAVQPFKLGDDTENPSRFEFIFRHEGVLYSYGFAATTRRVHEEWLFATYTTKETRLFERVTDENNKTTAEFGLSFKRGKKQGFLDFVAQGTRPNQLLLTECHERNVEGVKTVRDWFFRVLEIVRADSEWEQWPFAIRLDKAMKQFASNFLQIAGTGIETVEGEEEPFTRERLVHYSGIDWDTLVQNVKNFDKDEAMAFEDANKRTFFVMRGINDEPCVIRFVASHRTQTGGIVKIEMEEESEGTQRLFHLIPSLHILKTHPRVLIIDELDRRLHPLLTRLFVQAALDCRDDDPQGQLLFTTHDTNLLDLDLLRRDEIWFVEKDQNGATHLASLADWKLNGNKVRPDLDVEKGYLNGRFGAIPFFGDVSKLLCEPEAKEMKTPQKKVTVSRKPQAQLKKVSRRKAVAK